MAACLRSLLRTCRVFISKYTYAACRRTAKVQPTASPSGSSDPSAHRYRPCKILEANNVTSVIWFEDALAFHGSNAEGLDLYLLVTDARKAADLLVKEGYREVAIPSVCLNDERSCRGGIKLRLPTDDPEEGTCLVNAAIWHYDLQIPTESDIVPFPPFKKFLESMMQFWLEMSEEEIGEKYGWYLSLAGMISHGYTIRGPQGDAVRTESFAEQLRPEFSELHYDLIGKYPQKSHFALYGKHEYHAIRYRQIKEGKFTPRPYPTNKFPTSMAEYPDLTGLTAISEMAGRKKKRKKRWRQRKYSKPMQGIEEEQEWQE